MADRATIETVIVVGGGLAGLSAGCALAQAGFKVTLFERRPYVGGRASSYEHPGTGEIVDNCQHVLLGCCTNLIDLYRRTGVEDKIRWFERLTFLEPGGRKSELKPSFFPSPFHSTFAFLRAPMLSLGDKLRIARALMKFASAIPGDSGENFEQWLKRNGQSKRAVRHFWEPVLVSALNEHLHRISIRYAAQVFRESFLKSAEAGRMGVPVVPLTELYSAAVEYIRKRGGTVRLRAPVESLRSTALGIEVTAAGDRLSADAAVMAVPWGALGKFVESCGRDAAPDLGDFANKLEHLESSPITGIHLWFDRQITELEHAVLLDRTIQWMFHKSKLHKSKLHESRPQQPGEAQGSYVELVVSASTSLVEKQRQEIIDLAVSELAEFFPEAGRARLLKATVIKEVHATYSVQPGSDAYRPDTFSPWPNVFLAGDWTATGWPATMEGAVRSGYLAAEALASVAGCRQRFLVPDLPARGFMRMFEKKNTSSFSGADLRSRPPCHSLT